MNEDRQQHGSALTCDDFWELLQEVLDRREDPACDARLYGHAVACGECRRRLEVWRLVDEDCTSGRVPVHVTPAIVGTGGPPADGSGHRTMAWTGPIAVAASVVLIVGWGLIRDPASDARVQDLASVVGSADMQDQRSIHPGHWIDDVRGQDWLRNSMPTVRRVREGVAPLGRSLVRAVAVLTSGLGEGTT